MGLRIVKTEMMKGNVVRRADNDCASKNCIKNVEFSDEKKCTGDNFKCRDGSCISSSLTCDHSADCLDASDESDELCHDKYKTHAKCDPIKHFECGVEECILKKYVCDGRKNCLNGRDEDEEMCKKMNVN